MLTKSSVPYQLNEARRSIRYIAIGSAGQIELSNRMLIKKIRLGNFYGDNNRGLENKAYRIRCRAINAH